MKKLLVILIFTPIISLGQLWERTNGPYGGDVLAFLKNGNEIFAGGVAGIFYTNNEGGSWKHIFETDTIFDIKKHNNLLVAGSNKNIYISNDNGLNWNISSSGLLGDQVYCIESINNDIFIGTSKGVYKSTDSGLSWAYSSIGLPVTKINDFEIVGASIFCASNNGVYKSINNGLTWSLINSLPSVELISDKTYKNAALQIKSSSAGIYVVLGYNGLFFSDNLGNSWKNITPITNKITQQTYFGAATICVDNGVLYLGSGGLMGVGGLQFFTSKDNGVNWFTEDLSVFSYAINAYGNNIYVSSKEGILKSLISTTYFWENIGLGLANKVNGLISKNGVLHAATDAGVYYSSDAGNTWLRAKYNFPWIGGLNIISAENIVHNGNIILTNSSSGLCNSVDGVNYTKSNTNYSSSIVVHNNNFYNSTTNVLYKSTNTIDWTLVNNSIITQFPYIQSMKSSYPILYATSGAKVYISADDGVNFTLSNTSGEVLYTQGSEAYTGNAYSIDYGSSWTLLPPLNLLQSIECFIKYNNEYFIGGSRHFFSLIYKFSNINSPNYIADSDGLKDCNYTSDFIEHNGILFSAQRNCTYQPNGVFKYNPNLATIIDPLEKTTSKSLVKIVDFLGRETKEKKNEPLFYIFDDGSVEKKIIIE
jgi:hypothetical protein